MRPSQTAACDKDVNRKKNKRRNEETIKFFQKIKKKSLILQNMEVFLESRILL